MSKQKTWREQEQRLVDAWNAATERLREAQAEIKRQSLTQGNGAPSEECVRTAEAASAELEAMRRQVARMKVEFSTGKRY
jgi:selenocysteine lyase/cysteine desulfurase